MDNAKNISEKIVKSIELPLEDAWKFACEALWGTWVGCSVNYAEEFGWDKANERVVQRTDVEGAADAQDALERLKIEERDATAALRAGLFLIVNGYPGHETRIVDYTPNKATAVWNVCTQCNIAKEMGIAETYDMPKLCETWWKRIAKTVNSNLDAKFNQMICTNDGSCEVTIWKK
ncbi:MAG: hypothetical protein JSV76_01775 [Candidatus Bathyarchaeota archaeon]|nr:MAG: hypothetical protein JSV76_01775 [Candidatus Bathyarchaeota archaeon]